MFFGSNIGTYSTGGRNSLVALVINLPLSGWYEADFGVNSRLALNYNREEDQYLYQDSLVYQPTIRTNNTFSCWFNPVVLPRINNTYTLWSVNGSNGYFRVGINDTGSIVARLSGDGGEVIVKSNTNAVSADNWVHLYTVIDHVSDTCKLYINNNEVGYISGSDISSIDMTGFDGGSEQFTVGARDESNYFEGYIDHLIIFDKALNTSQRNEVYNNGKSVVYQDYKNIQDLKNLGVKHWYEFNSFGTTSDTMGKDSSGNANLNITGLNISNFINGYVIGSADNNNAVHDIVDRSGMGHHLSNDDTDEQPKLDESLKHNALVFNTTRLTETLTAPSSAFNFNTQDFIISMVIKAPVTDKQQSIITKQDSVGYSFGIKDGRATAGIYIDANNNNNLETINPIIDDQYKLVTIKTLRNSIIDANAIDFCVNRESPQDIHSTFALGNIAGSLNNSGNFTLGGFNGSVKALFVYTEPSAKPYVEKYLHKKYLA